MAKTKKYMLSGGLAFSEEKDMKKLNEYSKKGYHLKETKGLFYVLEKGEPNNYIYTVDYQSLKGEELGDYLQIANDSGWELIQKLQNILILRATEGTTPLYSDKDTLSYRGKYSANQIGKSVLSLVIIILAIICWRIFISSIITIKAIIFLTDIIIAGFIGFTFVLFIGYLITIIKSRKYSTKGR